MSLALDKSKQMMIYYISGGGKSALSCERSGTEPSRTHKHGKNSFKDDFSLTNRRIKARACSASILPQTQQPLRLTAYRIVSQPPAPHRVYLKRIRFLKPSKCD